jgi:glycosyltransferase involved in cell wall biosynthesis
MAVVKNPQMLLKVAQLMPNTHFVMAGGGELLEEIRGNKPANVTVIGWADASLFWSAVDCAVSTSSNEGMPISLIEAQLAGIPIVATDVGSSAEVISHSETGFLVRNDPLELVNSLELLIYDRELLKKMGERASLRASELFSVKKMIDAHQQAYKSFG